MGMSPGAVGHWASVLPEWGRKTTLRTQLSKRTWSQKGLIGERDMKIESSFSFCYPRAETLVRGQVGSSYLDSTRVAPDHSRNAGVVTRHCHNVEC